MEHHSDGLNARNQLYSQHIPDDTRLAIATSNSQGRGSVKSRLGLPVTIDVNGHAATVLACADTGSDVNIISNDLARTLGLQAYNVTPHTRQFTLANGKVVEALGLVKSICTFGADVATAVSMSCIFHVLLHVTSPIIMGMEFLNETKTMTEHRDRLVRVPRSGFQALSVCSLERPRQLLACALNQNNVLATPDTGSEIDLISPSFAHQQGLPVYHGEEMIELADGSVEITSGFIEVNLTISRTSHSALDTTTEAHIIAELYILKDLQYDLIVGEDTLHALEVFTNNTHALVPAPDDFSVCSLNRIRCRGTLEKMWMWISSRIGSRRDSLLESSHASSADNLADQRELDRREQETKRIAKLPAREQDAAITAEALLQQQYHHRDVRTKVFGDYFRCTRFLCNAAPFETQDELNAHRILHSTGHISLDNALTSRPLSPPLGSGTQASSSQTMGSFTCNYPNCKAQPFQTQYLLK
ncbi:hypothetical protein NX059_006446 [Plenodomus lindquistii]|nr:hypothetical protein NX059_006446 [Plenodomus lindquistii]